MVKRGRPRKNVVARGSGKRTSLSPAQDAGRKGSDDRNLILPGEDHLDELVIDLQRDVGEQSCPKRWGEEEEVLIDNEVGVDPLLDPPYLRALNSGADEGKVDADV
ncbi:hypothetical protein Dimus_024149, partial [Dionaea muscipula]